MTDMSIPQGWHRVPIGGCIVERRKSQINVEDATGYGNYPFFTSGEAVLLHDKKQVEGENIYIADGGTANVIYFDGDAAYSNHTYVVGSKDGYSTKFLFYALKYLEDYINTNYFQGTGLKNLQKKDFKHHELIIPSSLEEQERIAKALTQIDDAIDSSSRLIAKYELVKKGLMHDLLTYGIDKDGNIRSERTHQFKDSPIGRIPVEWEVVELSQEMMAIDAQPDHRTPAEVEDGVPYVGIGDIDDYSNLLLGKCRKVAKEVLEKQKGILRIEQGDIIYGKIGTIGNPKILPITSTEYAISANVIVVKPKGNHRYLYYTLMSDYVNKQVDMSIHATTQPAFGMEKIRALKIKRATEPEQLEIANVVSLLDEHINQMLGEAQKLRRIRSGLLSDLITGKVRI